jgi:hypothetical protein
VVGGCVMVCCRDSLQQHIGPDQKFMISFVHAWSHSR